MNKKPSGETVGETGASLANQFMKRRLKSGFEASLFFLFFLAGTLTIILSRVFVAPLVSSYSFWLAFSLPLVFILGYFFISMAFQGARLRSDQLGDNLYYLGLLYTLVSLAYALVIFTQDVNSTFAIIENFGIALSSTIFGLALRVFVNQMREDPVEIEDEARNLLADATQRLRANLDTAVRELDMFHKTTRQTLSESLEQAGADANSAMELNQEKFAQTCEQVLAKIETAFSSFSQNTERLGEASDATVQAIEALAERVENVEAPSNLISEKIEPAVRGITQTIERLDERSRFEQDQIQRVRDIVDKVVNLADVVEGRMQKLEERLAISGDFATQVLNAGSAMESLKGELDTYRSGLVELKQYQESWFGEFSESVESTVSGIKTHNDALASELEKSRALTTEVHTALTGMTKTLRDAL